MTANWNNVLKATEKSALNTPVVRTAFANNDVHFQKADLTRDNSEAHMVINDLGIERVELPFFVFLEHNKEPVVFDGVYDSPESFLEALTKASVIFEEPDASASNSRTSRSENALATVPDGR